MKKSAIALFFAAFLSLSALAQSVQEGINYIYAQRFQSAKSTFEKLLAANPNNIEANKIIDYLNTNQCIKFSGRV